MLYLNFQPNTNKEIFPKVTSFKFLPCCRVLFYTWNHREFYIYSTCSQFVEIFFFFLPPTRERKSSSFLESSINSNRITIKQGWYYIKNLTRQQHERAQIESDLILGIPSAFSFAVPWSRFHQQLNFSSLNMRWIQKSSFLAHFCWKYAYSGTWLRKFLVCTYKVVPQIRLHSKFVGSNLQSSDKRRFTLVLKIKCWLIYHKRKSLCEFFF